MEEFVQERDFFIGQLFLYKKMEEIVQGSCQSLPASSFKCARMAPGGPDLQGRLQR